jgi:hypothetical protein
VIRAREVAVKAVIDRAHFVPIAWSPGWPRPGPSKVDRIISQSNEPIAIDPCSTREDDVRALSKINGPVFPGRASNEVR